MKKLSLTPWFGACSALPLLLSASLVRAQDATTAGEAVAPYPTLENLSIEWPVSGDDNANGVVTVRFRSAGGDAWRTGLPLRRVPAGEAEDFSWENRHAGSVFGLSPATTYEIELTLDDPDGGSTTASLQATTRPVPVVPADATIVPVTPDDFEERLSQAAPGEVLLLADGNYPEFSLDNDGEPGRPIVLRAANERMAVIQGRIELLGRSHVFLEGLSIQGRVRINDSQGIVVRRCLIQTEDFGIVAYGDGSTNGYFCDNEIEGSTVWGNGSVGADGDNLGEGIELAGPGNVVCRNRVSGFRDCISTMEDDEAVNQVSLDVYRNDLSVCGDDAVEADFTMGNCRVYENQIHDSFVGISSQPGLGGPSYFIRNVMYNVIYSPFKLHRGSVGDVALHNSVVKCGDAMPVFTDDVWSAAWFRNNLFIGGTGGDDYGGYSNGDGAVANMRAAAADCDFDYDGFGSIGTGEFRGIIGETRFESLQELRASTTEAHAVQVDMSVFAESVAFPETPFPALGAPDLHLQSGGAAIDAGEVLSNINDDFAGDAPDLGAYELGASPIDYGPQDDGDAGAAGAAGETGSGGDTSTGGAVGSGGEVAQGGDVPQAGTEAAGSAGTPVVGSGGTAQAGAFSAGGEQAGAGETPAGAPGAGGQTGNAGSQAAEGGSTAAEGGSQAADGGSESAEGGSETAEGGSETAEGGQEVAGETTEAGTAGLAGGASEDSTGTEDDGCGCRVGPNGSAGSVAWVLAAMLALLRRRRGQQ